MLNGKIAKYTLTEFFDATLPLSSAYLYYL
jgi:hypothetical protein